MPWGAVIGAVGAIGSGIMSNNAASANRDAAVQTAQMQLNATQPYGMNTGVGSTSFINGQNGINQVYSQLSQPYQNLESGMLGGAQGVLGQLGALSQSGGISPLLANAYAQYQNSLPNQAGFGFGNLSNQAFNNGLGNQFGNAATGMLGQLGNFNPADFGAQYTNLLRQQAQPGEFNAAQNLAQNLFNTGNLGSSGGATQMQALQSSQAQADVARQMAGQQLGLQAQQQLASQAGQFGSLANSFNNTNFQQGLDLNNMLYGRGYNQSQQGFQNALALQSGGLQNLGSYSSLLGGLLSGGQSIDQALLNQVIAGGQLGAARTGAAINAGNTMLQGSLAANNTNAAMWNGLFNGISNANWGSLFKTNQQGTDVGMGEGE
jgi:hypothetical protein